MTKKTQVEIVKLGTFVVVFFPLAIGPYLLCRYFWGADTARSLSATWTTILAAIGANFASYFAVGLLPGTQKPQLNTEIIKRTAPFYEPVEGSELTVGSPSQVRAAGRAFAFASWAVSVAALVAFTGVLIPIEEQTGREWNVPIFIVSVGIGLFLWFSDPTPKLTIDVRGVSIGRKLIPWRRISHCEIHTRTDELGETSGVTLKLKNQSGGSLGTVFCTPNEAERARLRQLIHVSLGADAA